MSASAFIEENKAEFPVSRMCSILGVSHSWLYERRHAPISQRKKRDLALKELIQSAFDASGKTYGAPRLHAELKEHGVAVGRKRVARIMRDKGLAGKKRRRFQRTTRTEPNAIVAKDWVKQDFSPTAPNKVWVSDLTYVRTLEGWLYLVIFMDLFSRKIVAWALDSTMDTEALVLKAFRFAVKDRNPPPGLIVHSDRGSQYTSHLFRKELKICGFEQSMGAKGNCFDNAVAESFFDSYKTELELNGPVMGDAQVRANTFQYLEGFYNRRRRHSTLGYKSPATYEREFLQNLVSREQKVA